MTTSATEETSSDLRGVMADIASLRSDLAVLAGQFKTSATNNAGDAARRAARAVREQSSRDYDALASRRSWSTKTLSKQIVEQPLIPFLVAFGLGVLGSRLLAR
jgi:hypothetical protein